MKWRLNLKNKYKIAKDMDESAYGMLRRSNIRKVFSDVWLEGEELEAAFGELVNMLGPDQIEFQDSRRV